MRYGWRVPDGYAYLHFINEEHEQIVVYLPYKYLTETIIPRKIITRCIDTQFGDGMVEEGAILIVGEIITGLTMVMMTVIVLETDRGNFEVALVIILLFLFLLLPVNDAGWRDSPRPSCPGVD